MKQEWICVEVACDPELVSELAAEIAETFGAGVEELDCGVRYYLPGGRFSVHSRKVLERLLIEFQKRHSISELPGTSFSILSNEDWAVEWQKYFKPIRLGRHLLVAPTWEEVKSGAQDRLIRINPGRAFGTGHHETTRLCLEWLEGWADKHKGSQPGTLLDVGTGSGILALAGVLLGFSEVIGIDNDPEAIEVALENAELNGLLQKVEFRVATPESLGAFFDVVMANIQALPLIEMAQVLSGLVRSSGRIVLSGILLDQKEAVQSAYEARGHCLLDAVSAGEWCLLVFS